MSPVGYVLLGRSLAVIALALLALGASIQPASAQDDFAIAGGRFYTQTGGGAGLGFTVTDADDIPFWSTFQEGGGVAQFGYPISRRWQEGPLTYQAFQRAVLQWQPERGMFYVNIYDQLSSLGHDEWLRETQSVPYPQAFPEDAGASFDVVAQNHLELLELNPAIKAAWYANPRWLSMYGLPVAYEDYGVLRVLRAQRTVLQQWVNEAPWAAAGSVTLSLGGDHFKQAGLIPRVAAMPHLPLAVAQAGCASGGAVSEPAANPGLVEDCAELLVARDVLVGEGPGLLNWSWRLPLKEWEGVGTGGLASPGN